MRFRASFFSGVRSGAWLLGLVLFLLASVYSEAQAPYEFPDSALPPQVEGFPERPRMLLELGDTYYGVGELPFGVKPWKGTYWQPALWVFGDYRSAVQMQSAPGTTDLQTAQWRNRFDLFANLRLSGTERVVVGWRPIDRSGMTGLDFMRDGEFDPGSAKWVRQGISRESYRPEIFFIEGDIAELFQFLDYEDTKPLDIGFSVGRQNVFFQEGLLLNDIMDVAGLVFNGLPFRGTANLRITALWAFDGVNHGPNLGGRLYGVFSEADLHKTMLNLDVAFIDGGEVSGGGFVAGASAVQRIGMTNSAFRVAASRKTADGVKGIPGTRDGIILFNELSRKHYPRPNIVYFNHYVAYDSFTPASSLPPGPLGRIGFLFGGSPLGNFGPALGPPVPRDEIGAALGYQWILRKERRQFVAEVAGRQGVFSENDARFLAGGFLARQALGRRYILELDAYVSHQRDKGARFGSRFGALIRM